MLAFVGVVRWPVFRYGRVRYFLQKLEYLPVRQAGIHYNPVKAGLCQYPEDYKYSSARFYKMNETSCEFLTHYDG